MQSEEVRGFLFYNRAFDGNFMDAHTVYLNDQLYYIDHCLHKFKNDEILKEKEGQDFYYLDGHIDNKDELMVEWEIHADDQWGDACIERGVFENPVELRGGFCGFSVIRGTEWRIFTDHVGNRAIYYYTSEGRIAITNRLPLLLDLLKNHGITPCLNERACKYMLQQGFMVDESTFVEGVCRVLPGQIVTIHVKTGEVNKHYYHRIDNTHIQADMTEEEAVEIIDAAFRRAIRREFNKDVEYGYRHLADLSGGLDSRMTVWVAHEMGYTDQLNFTYCRSDYQDMKIAEKIAANLGHEFLFRSLDDFRWYGDWEENVYKGNGATLYSGITGGNRFLKNLNTTFFGIEHTGMVGDAIVGTFYLSEKETYGRPDGTENCYSNRCSYPIAAAILDTYPNRELYSIYTRGLLGAQSSYMIRQNYLETASPFLDVDFLNTIFTVPYTYRCRHHIYFRWIKRKYPHTADFGWEKWHGIRPLESEQWKKKIVNTWYKYKRKLIGNSNFFSAMSASDYWYQQNSSIRARTEQYYENNLSLLDAYQEIKRDVMNMFVEGSVSEKSQAITVITMSKMLGQ